MKGMNVRKFENQNPKKIWEALTGKDSRNDLKPLSPMLIP
jgi:hypothetical protein